MSAHSDDTKRSRRTLPSVSCTGKVPFDDFKQASDVVGRRRTKARPGRSAYRCGHCHKWHIGSDSGRVEMRKAAEFKERKQHDE